MSRPPMVYPLSLHDALPIYVRGTDSVVSAAVWTFDPAACSARASVAGRDNHPNAQWIAQQLTEAYGWKETPRYLVRDRDSAYGEIFTRRLAAMGIRDRPISN